MKKLLDIDRAPPSLERSLSAASKLKSDLPTDLELESIPPIERLSLVEDIHVKTREASQNTDLDMRKFMGIDKALQSIQGELLNNTSKLTEINKHIKRDTKKLEEIENDPTYTDEQRQLYRDRLDDSNAKKQARLEILSRVAGGFQPKEEGALKKWLGRLPDALKRLAGKAVEALLAIVGSVVGVILSFLGKAVGFVAEHTWALIVFVA